MLLYLFCTSIYAQNDVTKFLGIPVDGTKSEMIQKLKAKGYKYDAEMDWLEGEFNGTDVCIKIATNNNIVWRICIMDSNGRNETDIKIRFNKLCEQFENNKRYFSVHQNQTISEYEDISYQIMVNNKRYEASFYQEEGDVGTKCWAKLAIKYPYEQLGNLSADVEEEWKNEITSYLTNVVEKKSVWFMIVKSDYIDKYRILMYYDNKYNEASGEDL